MSRFECRPKLSRGGRLLSLAVGAVVLVSGCSGGTDGAGESPPASPGAAAPCPGGAEVAQIPDTEDWDAIRDRHITEMGEQMLRQGRLEALPTDAEFVCYISRDESGRVYAECISEQGFDATENSSGGVHFDVPKEQQPALAVAEYRCLARYPVHPVFMQPLTEEQVEILYDYYVDTLVPCLEGEGYDVGEVPTLETYKATRRTDEQWFPYNVVGAVPEDEWRRINEKCPQGPPTDVLYGDNLGGDG